VLFEGIVFVGKIIRGVKDRDGCVDSLDLVPKFNVETESSSLYRVRNVSISATSGIFTSTWPIGFESVGSCVLFISSSSARSASS
jgi:hypothetical protein